MITIIKDKNILKIEVSGTSGHYAFDINTGIFYGKKGSPVKTIPAKNEMANAMRGLNSNLGNIVYHRMYWGKANTDEYTRFVKAYMGADKLDSLGVCQVECNIDTFTLINDNFSAFTRFYRELNDEEKNNRYFVNNFSSYLRWEKAKQILGNLAELITPEMYSGMTNSGRIEYTAEEWSVIAYYLIKGKFWDYQQGNCHELREYIDMCRSMKQPPNKQNNFMREYCETKKTYELRKIEYDNEKMARNFALHQKAFEFAYGNYVVVIPKSAKEIVDEGANMHHCVGGYAQRVIDGRDYIVFVRHKDTPDKCYITCEIYTDGRMGQYFLAHDRYISSEEDIEFYREFEKHIKENW